MGTVFNPQICHNFLHSNRKRILTMWTFKTLEIPKWPQALSAPLLLMQLKLPLFPGLWGEASEALAFQNSQNSTECTDFSTCPRLCWSIPHRSTLPTQRQALEESANSAGGVGIWWEVYRCDSVQEPSLPSPL